MPRLLGFGLSHQLPPENTASPVDAGDCYGDLGRAGPSLSSTTEFGSM